MPPYHNDLEEIVKIIRETYIENSEMNLINEIYESQLQDILDNQSTDKIHFLKLVHQIKLGFVDSLMESCLIRDLYR